MKLKHLIICTATLGCAWTASPTGPVQGPVADVNGVVDNTPDSIELARTMRPKSGSTRRGNNPVLFLVGNSTMRTGTRGNGDNGQWGWGYFMPEYFDANRMTVENHALGGMSSRTFYKQLWPEVLEGVKPGDYVVIELGHNDNGPYDSGRARASIPGTGTETLPVIIKESGVADTVLTYGEYMRRFVRDVKSHGAHPILFSLTPRNAWDDKDSTRITRVDKTYGKWAREVAESEGVGFVDLNYITACKFEQFGKEKVKTMFYGDRIHTSEFGARTNAESALEGLSALGYPAICEAIKPEPIDTITGRTRRNGRPVVFIIGDSTVKNEDNGDDSMWGWGSVLDQYLDTAAVSVENHAMAGRSARTFLDEGRWEKVYRALQPGDYVLMQFGHNDGGDINTGKARGELHGAGGESKVFHMEKTGRNQVIYTYGWYLRKFVMDAIEKGATPIILSHTPRNKWTDGKIESNAATFGLWARKAALQSGAHFIDLNALSGSKLQALGPEATAPYFKNDHTHTSLKGAHLNASSIAEGLRATPGCGLGKYVRLPEYNFDMTKEIPAYNEADGYGYDFGTHHKQAETDPYYFSVRVPDGNYIVDVTLGSDKRPASTTVRAESRRLMVPETTTRKGGEVRRSFVVNKRNTAINLRDSVRINPREDGTLTWDDKLTLEITGNAPAVKAISIRPAVESDLVTTVFLCGNSTVVDQTSEPWASWGQMITAYAAPRTAIANHAESGERTSSFIASGRLDKVLACAHPGDWIIMEFGHNDQKERQPGSGAYYNFATNLKIFIDRAREAGLRPVLITPTARRSFGPDGKVANTHGDYPDAMREVAQRENVPLIELNGMTMTLYEALGEDGSRKAFVHYPANTYPGQTAPLADNTHFNPYGAMQVAKCVLRGIAESVPELAPLFKVDTAYDPEAPDEPASFQWTDAIFTDPTKPYGN